VSTKSSRSMKRPEKRSRRDAWPATRKARLTRRAPLVVSGLALLALVAHRPTSQPVEAVQLSAPDSAACKTNIEGWRFPTEVPSYMQWEPVLAALAASDDTVTRPLNVGGATLGEIKAEALSGLGRARQMRTTSNNDIAAAAAILDSRDKLIRQLPATTFDDLQAIVWKRTEAAAFKLPTTGKRVMSMSAAVSPCRVEADFTKQPHLVPEYVMWNAYFGAQAAIASQNRLQDGSFSESFIAGMRTGLRVQPSSMISLLENASDAAAQVEALRSQNASDRQIEAMVMTRRAQLIRTLPRRDWAEIKFAVAQIGGTYFFPPGW
jgi:hypothetical protein